VTYPTRQTVGTRGDAAAAAAMTAERAP